MPVLCSPRSSSDFPGRACAGAGVCVTQHWAEWEMFFLLVLSVSHQSQISFRDAWDLSLENSQPCTALLVFKTKQGDVFGSSESTKFEIGSPVAQLNVSNIEYKHLCSLLHVIIITKITWIPMQGSFWFFLPLTPSSPVP